MTKACYFNGAPMCTKCLPKKREAKCTDLTEISFQKRNMHYDRWGKYLLRKCLLACFLI